MTQTLTRPARRLTRPRWRDSRLLVGILLVLVSTALGGWVLAHADDTEPMYAAKSDIVPGQRLTAEDLVVVDARIGDGAARYLPATGALPDQAYALRALRPGELIPAADVGPPEQVRTRVVTVTVDATSAEGLRRGSVVDVWVNRLKEGSSLGRPVFAGPERLLESVAVARLGDEGRVLGTTGSRTVAVIVPAEDVGKIVGDADAGARITLIATPGDAAGSAS